MTRFLPAVIALLLIAFTVPAGSQTASKAPQDVYLQIYLQIQEAERLEGSGQKLTAKNRYQAALERLTELQKSSPQWEPTIVKYRMKYCQDKIETLADARDANPAPTAATDPEPAAPETTAESNPPTTTPPATLAVPKPEPEPEADTTTTPVPTPTPTPEPTPPVVIPTPPPAVDNSAETNQLKKQVQELQNELTTTKQKLDGALAEAAQLKTLSEDLKKQLADARKGSSEQMDKLLAENKGLKEKLTEANSQVEKLQKGEKSVANLEEQVKKLKDQLETSQKQNEELVRANEGYRKQLEETQKTIAETTQKLAALEKDSKVSGPLVKENQVLRGIIERQLKEQARRDAAKRLALEEITALNIQSTTLRDQLQILGTPVVELTAEEKALLKLPVAEPVKDTVSVDNTSGSIAAKLPEGAGIDKKPRIPEEFRDVAEQAQKLFAQRKFDEAAAKYQIILNTYPDSLYALSNLGVVRFQQGNYPAAEKALRRAVDLAPQDAFSHTILGISLYQQGKYDQAITILQRAIALDPKDPKTRNYLGISLSQLGRQESAEQQCRKAIELDDTYGDAHFNLAVIYATQKPPAKELARRHYKRALELGVPRDPQLEDLLK